MIKPDGRMENCYHLRGSIGPPLPEHPIVEVLQVQPSDLFHRIQRDEQFLQVYKPDISVKALPGHNRSQRSRSAAVATAGIKYDKIAIHLISHPQIPSSNKKSPAKVCPVISQYGQEYMTIM
jgi:hypothetical protein